MEHRSDRPASAGAVGTPIPRRDGLAKVTGEAVYGADIAPPGALTARVLAAGVPCARIRHLDVSRAWDVPGVRAVVTGADCPRRHGPFLKDQPALAVDEVRHSGEIVAAVAAEDADAAEEAIDRIVVEYEPLTPVLSLDDALAPDAPLVHPEWRTYEQTGALGVRLNGGPGGNVPFHFRLRTGDVDRGFAEADVVVERTYTTQFVQHCHLEPHAVVARFDHGGGLSVWTSTAGPHTLRGMLAELLDLPLGRVRVHVPGVGGAFGSKMYLRGVVPPAVLLARAVPGRPVRLVFDRTEEFRSAGGRVPMRITMRTGARRDGTLTARQVTMWGEQGAYADVSPLILRSSGYSSPGPYRIPNAHVDAYLVYTNRVPSGAFRALGVPQTCWAGEQQMDELAAELGMSPVELRRINLLRDGDTSVTGEVMRDVGAGRCLDAVAARATPGPAAPPDAEDGPAERRSLRGTGVALVWKSSLSPAVSFATVRLNHDGGVELNTAAVDNGQGAHTVLAQIAAETLSVPVESIHVAATDTQANPFDRGSTASRTTFAMGNAVRRASAALLDRLREVAAGVLETAPSNLVFENGTVSVAGGDPRLRPTYGEVITRYFNGPGELVGNGHYGSHHDHDPLDPATGRSTRPTPFWMYGAVAADVEVDAETGRLTVRRVVNVVDAGRAINPLACETQIHGATLQGLGMALMEDLRFPGGVPRDTSFGRYRIPAFGDLPEIESVVVETPTGDGPFGARGIGEIGLAAVPAAIGNAVHAATGRRTTALPISARDLAFREEEAR